MIEVIEVATKKQQKEFLDFPLKLYKKNPYFVPPLYADEKAIFKSNYHYYEVSEAKYYLAYKDGKVAGRISAILQKSSNEKWNQKRVRFTRFDCIDDQEVADALFLKVEQYAKEKQMEEIVGPLGFSDLEREGLLIEGFDYLSTYEEQYNYSYYQKLIENYGFGKEIDWLEHRLFYSKEGHERLKTFSERILQKYELRINKVKNINYFIKHYAKQFFEILDTTYAKIYGTVPITDNMRKSLIQSFKLVVRPSNIGLIVDKNDRIVAFALSFPAFGEELIKSSGHLTIPTIFKVLKAVNHPTHIDLGLIGVLPEFEMKGVVSAMLASALDDLEDGKIEYYETNLNLENNYHIINQWKNFKYIQHKRRRSFIKKIS